MTNFNGEPVRSRTCGECPWRKDSAPGWLGPHSAEEWNALAHSDAPIACHASLKTNESWEGAQQCAGAASYRRHICKSPRDARIATGPEDRENIFGYGEFVPYHTSKVAFS